jgi:HAMP domain-containing protein
MATLSRETGSLDKQELLEVLTRVKNGDFTRLMSTGQGGIEGQIAETTNALVRQLNPFAAEVTRISREIGAQGIFGGQAQAEGLEGTWKDLIDNINRMGANLTCQIRDVTRVVDAQSKGNLAARVTVEAGGEMNLLKGIVNDMGDHLQTFAGEATRVVRELGTEGRFGCQAVVPGVAGTWKDLTDNINVMATNLTEQVRYTAEATTAVARGDFSRKVTVEAQGVILHLKQTINMMVDQLNAFAAEVTRVVREIGTEGRFGGQAEVPGLAGTWKDLTDSINLMARHLTDQIRDLSQTATGVVEGNPSRRVTVGAGGEMQELKETINRLVDQASAR